MKISILTIIFCALGVSSCSLRSDYQQPALNLPDHWQGDTAAATRHSHWWYAYDDAQLNQIVDRVLDANLDLAAAGLKHKWSLVGVELAQGQQRPSVRANINTQLSQRLSHGHSIHSHSSALTLGYEIDLWGRLSATEDAARWQAEAMWQDREATRLLLINKTITHYWHLAYLYQAINLAGLDLGARRQQLTLTQSRFDAGMIGRLELLQAQQSVAGQDAALVVLTRQQSVTRNALRLLLGRGSGELPVTPTELSTHLPALAAGLPAELLAYRPDLKAAELRLRQRLADGDQIRASFYPNISLSAGLRGLLQDPMGTLGAGLTLPFLEYRKARQSTSRANLAYQQAETAFTERLYKALLEVDDAISNLRFNREQESAQKQQLVLARQAAAIARSRYLAGATGIGQWIKEQNRLRQVEMSWLTQRQAVLEGYSQLFAAIGCP